MNAREMLELTAKACGYQPDGSFGKGLLVVVNAGKEDQRSFGFDPWNDDGDCARMEAELGICIQWENLHVEVFHEAVGYATECYSDHGNDRRATRRYASTRLAAEFQKQRDNGC